MGRKRKVCRGKKKFATRNGAAGWAAGKRRFYGRPYRAHRCEFCGAWHVDAVEFGMTQLKYKVGGTR